MSVFDYDKNQDNQKPFHAAGMAENAAKRATEDNQDKYAKQDNTPSGGNEEHFSLNDDRRVKVLSPGALVAKRFFLETDGFYTEIAYHLNEFSLRDGHQIYTVVLSAEAEEALELPDVLQDPLFDGIFLTTPRTRTSTMVWTWCSTASRAGSSTTRTRRSA